MRIGKFVGQENRRRRDEGTHLCGVLVTAHPDRVQAVGKTLEGMSGVEVHQVVADGRLIVTVEDTADEWAGQILTRLPTVEGVLSAALVYHHCE
ncbi:chaperone NapD [Telmatospirillum sp.]|uniref:chaperone NapD n=1 Tax=Telmatospirillum sp. TaxID=2079197 RepID=UPI00284C8D67|nr:chaperone NapD [Telmatospirillum sp.]MDR3439397.1 chaperone NapD [Telmatospirillum sp.]